MTALQAQEITQNHDALKRQLEHLNKKIRDAALNGETSLRYGKVEPEVLHVLEDNGFKVSTVPIPGGAFGNNETVISWEKQPA